MNDRSRPKAAPTTTAKQSAPSVEPEDDIALVFRAWHAGYAAGLAHGQRLAVEDMARALLHEQALEMQGRAVRTARERHGEAWAAAIREQAEVA